jgi:Secretory lipase
MNKFFIDLAKIFLFVAFISSCGSKNDPTPANVVLLSSTIVKEYSKEEFVKELSNFAGPQSSQLSLFVRSGLKTYKISYKTTGTDGEVLTASGALIVPKDLSTEALALGSLQHGTILNESSAPSYANLNTEFGLGAFLASTGTIIGMPDYLGYGDSKAYPHPYEHQKSLAKTNIDFLRAVKELIRNEKINWNNNLLLAGYSEGGYATLATQKAIEENYSTEFNLKASSCGAGAYNKTSTLKSFLKDKTSGEPNNNKSYIWVLQTYDRIYKLNRPLSNYFIEPYLTEITKTGYNTVISKSFDSILNPTFIKGLLDGTDKAFITAVSDNDIFDWKPKTVTRLYHGDADTYVPIINTLTTYEAMKAKGAENVSLFIIKGGKHDTSVGDFFTGTFDLFNKYK